ncbi:RNA polymerase sigma-54 factor [Tabrizicola piscis]|uniref:RNA polymerase sigma-54 factor n=1 Tax=Tabrizicola piscis TaxID=2494374 RepID=A0A3S8U2L5_9RHOB|nr:RNA polymerase sigma-54 factor [Tabrizicola piscis]AZL57860.1 RNA polymerase sigma-54 factor [Tabrizicola piscis]
MKSRNRISIQQTQRLKLTMGLATSIRILRSDAQGLSRYLEEQAAENPQLVLTRASGQDWLPRWKSALGAGAEPPEQAAAGASLVSHVFGMIAGLDLSPREARIADALADALEPSGWLGQSPTAIAARIGVGLADVELMLRRLQARAEPTGLFARNLAECLRLQAEDADEMDAIMAAVLDRLDLVARGEIDRLARETGVSPDAVRLRIGRLRGYDPKPGAGFEPYAAPIREPDLVAEKGASGWTVAINRSALPSVSLAEGKGPGRAEARAILRMVEGRNVTLLAVGQEILVRQVAALEEGMGALVPMTMADVAVSVGLHESTVSRVVAGTAVDTPRGTWWLRALFTQATQEGGPAAGALRDRLAQLIAAEDPRAPLSDAALAVALSGTGAPLARRTVAKYRTMLKLPTAARRKRRSPDG